MRDKLLLVSLLFLLTIASVGLVNSTHNQAAAAITPPPLPICPTPFVTCSTISLPTITVSKIITPPGIIKRQTTTVTAPHRTVFKYSTSTATVTLSPPPVTATQTKTYFVPPSTVTMGGQTVGASVTMVPTTRVITRHLPGTTITVEKAQKVGLGILSLLLILACIIGGMWYAWHEGVKRGINKTEAENVGFLRWMRDTIRRPRGKHMLG